MNKPLRLPLLLLTAFAIATNGTCPLLGQQPPQARVSPQDTINADIDGTKVTLVYSRPNLKDPKSGEMRKIWGGLVPYGKVWRTGANEATLLTTQAPIQFGSSAAATVSAGTYSLFTLPEEGGGAKLIVNKQTGQWGTKYDEKQDLIRVDLKKADLEKLVEQFTMAIEKNPAGGGVLKLMWETTEYSVSFTIKK